MREILSQMHTPGWESATVSGSGLVAGGKSLTNQLELIIGSGGGNLEATRHAADPFGAIPRPFWGPSGDYLGPWPQDGAKMAPKGPKMAKSWTQGGPKRPHNGPRWPRDGHNMGPTGPKM